MKILKQLALGALTAASGVLIACAYGVSYVWSGRVLGRDTQQPIPGIRVECVSGTSGTVATTTTDADGHFRISGPYCEALRFTDVDGAQNGAYDATTLEEPSGVTDGNQVELEPTALP